MLAVIAAVSATALGVTVSAASSSPTARTQHFIAFNDNPRSDGLGHVWAFGPVSGRGSDVVINDSMDRVVFASGSLTLRHHTSQAHDNFDPATCVSQHEESGTYTVVSGTGAYAGAQGNGVYKLNVLIQGCHQNQPPQVFALDLDAVGPLTV